MISIRVLEILEATVGGTRRHLTDLLDGIDRTEFTVEIAAPLTRHGAFGDTTFASTINALGIPLHEVSMRREISPYHDLRALWRLYHLIRREKYDIVHCHSSKAGFLGRVAARLNGVPTVYTPNGFYFLLDNSAIKRRFFLWLERIAGRWTNKLIAVSDGELQAIYDADIISPDQATMIPNSIDPANPVRSVNKISECSKLGLDPTHPIVGTISRLTPQKDPLTWIEASKLIHDKHPHVQFVWCGSGELESTVKNKVKELGLEDQFLFLGYREDALEIAQIYDVFVLSSVYEGLPYSLLEVMALSIPVVATDTTGSSDLIVPGETGILVPSGCPNEIAKGVLTLLTDASMASMYGTAGHYMVRSKYNLQTMIRKTEAVYRDLYSNNKAGTRSCE